MRALVLLALLGAIHMPAWLRRAEFKVNGPWHWVRFERGEWQEEEYA